MASINVFDAHKLEARAGHTSGAPMCIKIKTDDGTLTDDITFFVEDHAYAARLADASNSAVAVAKTEAAC